VNATVLERREALPAPVGVRARPFPLRRVLAAAGVALLLGAGSWYGHRWWTVGRFLDSTDDAFVVPV
jgi:membrane fusion protein (multidrug efflux system)